MTLLTRNSSQTLDEFGADGKTVAITKHILTNTKSKLKILGESQNL